MFHGEEFILSKIENKERQENAIVPTLNKMGYMNEVLNEFTQEYLEFLKNVKKPTLDIGTAFGFTVIKALEQGASVFANDIDKSHLEVLSLKINEDLKGKLTLKPGSFPDDLSFEENSLGCVLASRMLHFLPGDKIEKGLTKIFRWLEPQGKVFVIAETPYKKMFQRFIPLYEERKKAGVQWPGEMENMKSYMDARNENLPDFMNLLEEDVLLNAFKNAGFLIEKSKTFSKSKLPEDAQLDGRESVGLVAIKP